jgi:ADP-heptose:LPS heptosyltransferase
LAKILVDEGHTVVFTGLGVMEDEQIRLIADKVPELINLCSKINWNQFVAVITHAQIVVAVDSLAGHVAAATDTPEVIIGNGMSNPMHWCPLSEKCVYILNNIHCVPCHQKRGCESMSCIRDVPVDTVIAAVKDVLASVR